MAKNKNKVFAVFGLGNFGQVVAEVLTSRGGQVIAVDNNKDIIDDFKNKVSSALLLDSTDEHALAKAPLEDVDVAIIAVDDMETSIITTALLKKMGVPYILCRGNSQIHAQVLQQIGANEVVNLQEDEGRRIATRLITPDVLETIPLTEDVGLAEYYIPDMFKEKRLQDLKLEGKFNVRVVGVKRVEVTLDSEGNPERAEKLLFFGENDTLQENDILLVIGKNADLEAFKEELQ